MIYFESKINKCIPGQQLAYTKLNKYSTSVMSRSGLEISFKLSVYVKADTDNPLIHNADLTYGYVITSGAHAVYSEIGGFEDFRPGDLVYNTGEPSIQAWLVQDVLDNGKLLVLEGNSALTTNTSSTTSRISLWTYGTLRLEFASNLISKNLEVNDENSFLNNAPEWSRTIPDFIPGTGITYFENIPGNKANRNTGGLKINVTALGANVDGVHVIEGVISYSDSSQTFLANNWWREDELENIQNNIKPDRYLNDFQNFITKFRIRQYGGSFQLNGEWREFLITNNNTEISWFNRKQDTISDTEFFVNGDVEISDSLTSDPQEFIAINKSTDVKFNIKNAATFTGGGALTIPIKVNFCLLPTEEEYSNNNYTQAENFVFDDRIFAVGATTGNGNNYLTNLQVLTGIFITPISGTEAEILFTTNFGTLAKEKALAYENKKCLITVNTYGDDETCLVIGVFELKYVSTPGTLGTLETFKLMRHFETDETDTGQGQSTEPLEILKEDEFWLYKKFDLSGITYSYPTQLNIDLIRQKIIARNLDTNEEFDLDVVNFNTSAQSDLGGLQLFTNTQDRNFQFNELTLKRCQVVSGYTAPVDIPLWYLELRCAYQLRWEYFKQLLNVNGAFYDTSEMFNGYNQNWIRYQRLLPTPKWKIYEQTIIDFQYYDESLAALQPYTQIDEHELKLFEYNSNVNYTTREIKTFKINQSTLAEITDITPNILNYEKTKVKVTFENVNNIIAASSVMVIRLEAYENGGWTEIEHISSHFDTQNNVFESVDGSGKIVLTQNSATEIMGEAIINQNFIPNFSKIKISARIYGDDGISALAKEFEDAEEFLFEDDTQYEFETP